MSRTLTTLVTAALALTASAITPIPADAAPAAAARSYPNCTALNRDYPAGVGRRGARDKTSGTPVRNFKVDNALYNSVARRLDRDKDGIACEKLTKGNSTGSRSPKRKTPVTKKPSKPVKKTTARTIATSGGVAFTTPSGNITCTMLDGILFCSIEERTYRLTGRPADCHEVWGSAFFLLGQAQPLCSDATLYGMAPASSAWFRQTKLKPVESAYGPQAVLPYGWTLRNPDYTCTSQTTGVTCTDRSTGHGLMLSRARYRSF